MMAGATIGALAPTRQDLAVANLPLFEATAATLARSSPKAFTIIVSNPIEVAVAIFGRHLPRERVVGMGAQQDSLRFARGIAARLELPASGVRASVLGERMLPMWSSVYLAESQAGHVALLNDMRERNAGC